ncbi:MAG: Acetate kinase [Tenericutes bacterium ADurb.Bin087]|nr:MAG: Acetate kinase [Tenericutes bacterium ADurb.Bin087]
MSELVLAINSGSSSLKFKLFEVPSEKVITSGLFERITQKEGGFRIKTEAGEVRRTLALPNHEVAVNVLTKALIEFNIVKSLDEIKAIGHRVVQGGKHYFDSVEFTDEVAAVVRKLIPFAPLHNPAHLTGYEAFKKILPNVLNVAVFDTAYHQTMAPEDYLYPIPYEYYEKYDIRRYGAHGTSHKFIAEEITKINKGKPCNLIVCHLGNGASITAVKDGKCVATSMGLTPLGGIMMGTRTGDLDPSVFYFVSQLDGKSATEVYDLFNKKSGMLGFSGISSDVRDVENAFLQGNERADLTFKLYSRRVADYIGQYHVRLGGTDAIVFTAGIGENAPILRKQIIDQVKDALQIDFDEEQNRLTRGGIYGLLTTKQSKVKVYVIPTDEELMIVRDCVRILKAKRQQ